MQMIDSRIKWLENMINRGMNECPFNGLNIMLYRWIIDKVTRSMTCHAASHSSIHTLKRPIIQETKQLHVLTDVFYGRLSTQSVGKSDVPSTVCITY